jgi:multiple sugar transport system substrate-binding protein
LMSATFADLILNEKEKRLVNQHRRKSRRGLAVLASSVLATAGLSVGVAATASSASTSITLTELDYFSAPGQLTALNGYIKSFEASHPGVTVDRSEVPYGSLITKVLTDASAHDMPNLVAVDNPDVPEVVQTGQMLALSSFKGFTTNGYYTAATNECLFGGKSYCYPVGANSVALIYNIAMLKAAHISPPTTWTQLIAAAKALTTSKVYGLAFSAIGDEESTWQFEPFFWSDGGNLAHVDSTAGVQALTLWKQLIDDGSVSKASLNWGQTPDVSEQFLHGQAAMMVNGPWNFTALNEAGMYYGKQFGIVPVPVRTVGQKVVVPLGGEDWMVGNSGSSAQQQMAWEFIQGMQSPSVMLPMVKAFGYLPAKPAVTKTFLATAGPEWNVFANQTLNARPRTLGLGAKYANMSEAVWTAIQAALSGTSTPSAALSTAQNSISAIISSS